jgi:phosphatidylglycerol lysyltransferase
MPSCFLFNIWCCHGRSSGVIRPWRFWLGTAASLLIFVLALSLLYHIGDEYHWRDVSAEIRNLPWSRIVLALFFTVMSYLLLTLYDTLAVRQVGGQVPYPKIALTSFIAYTFSNTLGFALLTGTSVRYRFYSALGLSTGQIARVVFFCSVTFFLGLFLVGGLSLSLGMASLPATIQLPGWLYPLLHSLGLLAVGLALAYLVLPLVRSEPLRFRNYVLPLPRWQDSAAQMLVAIGDWMAAAAVCYVLLPTADGLSYWHVLSIFVVANLLGVLAHVPGGIGVFESVVTLLLAPLLPAAQVLGALIFYRLLYYVLPFFTALMLFASLEVLRHRQHLGQVQAFLNSAREFLPALISLGAFAAGTLLLFSGATPGIDSRLTWLLQILPLPLLEMSHLMGSISGVLLLLLARSLYRRYDAAFRITQVLLVAGILFSLLKGLDWEEATLLGTLFVAMWPCQSLFYRRGSLIHAPFTLGWLLAFGAVLLGACWLLLFSYRHVDYSHDLWWLFSPEAMASRGLRALGGVVGVVAAAGFAYLLRPMRINPGQPSDAELGKAQALVAQASSTHGHLAQLRDKSLLFHPSGEAFLMYAIEGSSWVVMGDPIGKESRFAELLWQFRELCDYHDGSPVFYQVRPHYLPDYLELGLTPFKLGEEAIVDLRQFTLSSSKWRSLRQSHAKALRDGLSFEVIPAEAVAPWLPQLRAISDAWMEGKEGREKGFSVGSFEADYLCSGPVALVRHEQTLVGFANLWTSQSLYELSVDLMRYHPGLTSGGVMDFLFTELLAWGQVQGYQQFNLGMAPMSGFANHPLASFWGKLGKVLYVRGNRFYNFQGLRRYKEKFNPEWQPRYLLCPGGMALPRILTNLVSLISRGPLGVLHK